MEIVSTNNTNSQFFYSEFGPLPHYGWAGDMKPTKEICETVDSSVNISIINHQSTLLQDE